jgi:hypothetical protein
MDQVERMRTNTSNTRSFFLSRSATRWESGDDAAQDLKGPLGLNTLHRPSDPAIADMVFIHGLGGGSRSTWTKGGDRSLYWPQEWLPNDPGFQDVRIHSFGYSADWEKESTLNINDFAKSLLGSLQDCPVIPRDTNVGVSFPKPAAYYQCFCSNVHARLQSFWSATAWEVLLSSVRIS